MSTQSQLVTNLQSIYQIKGQIKAAIPTNSEIFADYPSYISALHPSGGIDIVENGNNINVASYSYVNVAVPTSGGGSGSSSDYNTGISLYDIFDANPEGSPAYIGDEILLNGVWIDSNSNYSYYNDKSTGDYTASWEMEYTPYYYDETEDTEIEGNPITIYFENITNSENTYYIHDIYDYLDSYGEEYSCYPLLKGTLESDGKGNYIFSGEFVRFDFNINDGVTIAQTRSIGLYNSNYTHYIDVQKNENYDFYAILINNGKARSERISNGANYIEQYVTVEVLDDGSGESSWYEIEASLNGVVNNDIYSLPYISNEGKWYLKIEANANVNAQIDSIKVSQSDGTTSSFVATFNLEEPVWVGDENSIAKLYLRYWTENINQRAKLILDGIDIFGTMTGTGR